MEKLIGDIIDNLRQVFQAINEDSKKAEKDTGLTGPQLWAIKNLADTAPIKGAELARRMYLHPATIVGILDRLEAKGLVSRTRSLEDRRVVEIDLTESGREVATRSPKVAQGLLVDGLESLPKEQLLQIVAGMNLLVKILEAERAPGRAVPAEPDNLPMNVAANLPAFCLSPSSECGSCAQKCAFL